MTIESISISSVHATVGTLLPLPPLPARGSGGMGEAGSSVRYSVDFSKKLRPARWCCDCEQKSDMHPCRGLIAPLSYRIRRHTYGGSVMLNEPIHRWNHARSPPAISKGVNDEDFFPSGGLPCHTFILTQHNVYLFSFVHSLVTQQEACS